MNISYHYSNVIQIRSINVTIVLIIKIQLQLIQHDRVVMTILVGDSGSILMLVNAGYSDLNHHQNVKS